MAGLSLDSPVLWTVLGLAPLSVLLATLEHGWQKLSRARLVGGGNGLASRERLVRLLAEGDHEEKVESALMLLRVAVQMALVMGTLLLLHEWLPAMTVPELALWAGGACFAWILLFCRALPEELGADRLLAVVRVTTPVVVPLARALAPPIDLLRRLLRRLTGHSAAAEAAMVTDEILSAVEEGEREGHLGGEQADMIEHILELRQTEVHKPMTPRTELDVIDIACTVGQARAVAREHGRSRYPLVEQGDVDRVVGVVHVKDLLDHDEDAPVKAAAREPLFIPETKYCTELLAEFRRQRAHLAVVLDEYGGTAGVITIEDVLEEIVGEIDDEFDAKEQREELRILDDRHAVAPGTMHVDELNDALSLLLPESDDWTTLGGYIFHTLGRLPTEGETLTHANVVLTVERVIERRVDRVRIEILEPTA